MSLVDSLAVAEEYRVQFANWKQDLCRLACPAQCLFATKRHRGRTGCQPELSAVQLPSSPSRSIRWRTCNGSTLDTPWRAHPYEVAKAVMEQEPKSWSRS